MKNSPLFFLSFMLFTAPFALRSQEQQQDQNEASYYEQSFAELQSMLEGQTEVNFERAVYLSEAPYWQNSYSYEEFQAWVNEQQVFVNMLADATDGSDSVEFEVKVNKDGIFAIDKLRYTTKEKEHLYHQTLNNWAIFTWLTDTVDLGFVQHYPFTYASNDPFGRKDWQNSQVANFAKGKQGNCYALTALYKILANRLGTEAELCTAPQHIYIRHRDTEGRAYNVELATAGFPTDGQLQTLTHTPSWAIRNGTALRSYTEQQSIGLCLVNLAKAYEHQFNTKVDDFIIRCAALALEHDPKNLNALLLKQQVLDERLREAMNESGWAEFAQAKGSNEHKELATALQEHLITINKLGYLPMPAEMQRIILQGIQSPEDLAYYQKDKNPSPFTSFTPPDENDAKYLSLSGGLFQEVFDPSASVTYGHFTFDPVQKQITNYHAENHQQELIDPVAFAYNFGARMYDARLGRWLSRDPLERKYPGWSPYNFVMNTPLIAIDPDGADVYFVIVTGGVPDGQAAAQTRVNEIHSMEGFDPSKDHVYMLEVTDLGKLEKQIESSVQDAHENGYGETFEASFFGHAANDGPVGSDETSGKYSLANATGNNSDIDGDQNQLSPRGWQAIDFNFAEGSAIACFYGCKSAYFAQKMLFYQPTLEYAAGIGGSAGASYTYSGEFENVVWNLFGSPVYMVDANGGQAAPRFIYGREVDERERQGIDASGNEIPNRYELKPIEGNVTVYQETKKPKSGSTGG